MCELCETGELGDEFHYLFNCKDERIVRERMKALSPYYMLRPNILKFYSLMNNKSNVRLKKVARFAGFILNIFK